MYQSCTKFHKIYVPKRVPNLTKLMKNDRIIIQKCKEKHAFMHIFLHKCVYLVDDQGLDPWAH